MKRLSLFLVSSFLFASAVSAQLLSINDAETKFETSVEYHGGTPIKENPDGRIFTHEALWHNFYYTPLAKVGVEAHHIYNDGGDNKANHYFRVGLNGMKVFLLPGKTTGIAVTANLYAEASKYGFHHFDGIVSTLMMYKMDPNNSQGVGFVFLLNNPSKMIALPIFTWNRTFNKHWSLYWMTWLGDFNYHFTDKLKLTASYGFGFDRNWMDYQGQACMANQIVFTPALSLQYQATRRLNMSVAGGYQVAFMGTLFNETGTKAIKRLDARNAPYAQAKLTYRL